MANELQNKVFHDETKARKWLEAAADAFQMTGGIRVSRL